MNEYDIVIVSHEKDFNNIKFIVKQCSINLNFNSIHLILSDRVKYTDLDLIKSYTDKQVYLHLENDVLKIDKEKISYRPNWIYQMMLKIFQNVTEKDNFLIIEADCLILKKIEFFNGDKTIFYLTRDQYHLPYFNFNKKVLNLDRISNHSLISEFMMYDKKKINHMLKECNCENVTDFINLIYDTVDDTCYPADYELYGNFCLKYYPENFITQKIDYNFYGRESSVYPFWRDYEIENLIKDNETKSTISFHTWGKN